MQKANRTAGCLNNTICKIKIINLETKTRIYKAALSSKYTAHEILGEMEQVTNSEHHATWEGETRS